MKRAILLRFVAILMLALAVSGVSYYFIGKNMLKSNRESMLNTIHVVDYSLNYDGDLQEQLSRLHEATMDENSRVTIIGEDGTVVADNEIEQVDSWKTIWRGRGERGAAQRLRFCYQEFGKPGREHAVCGGSFQEGTLCGAHGGSLYQYAGLHDTDFPGASSGHRDCFCHERRHRRAFYKYDYHALK